MRLRVLYVVLALIGCGARDELSLPAHEMTGAGSGGNGHGGDGGGACEVTFGGDTGEHTCSGCPDIDGLLPSFVRSTSDSVFVISSSELGEVLGNAGPGKWRVESAEGLNEGPISEGPRGSYDTKAPLFCGSQTVDLGWCNDSGTTSYRFLIERQECLTGGLHVTLTWGAGATDLELHLIREGAHINDPVNDCTWTTCVGASPDWGRVGDPSDDPHKDIDWIQDNGVENIELAKLEAISYAVLVEFWGSGNPITAQVTVNAFGMSVPLVSPRMTPHTVWVAATIDAQAGTIVGDGQLVDCSGAWRNGCQLAIP